MYTPEGRTVTARLWEETLEELGFVGIRGILESIKS